MAALEVFFPDVMPRASSAPDPVVRWALRRSAREFCRRTLIWRQWLACVQSADPTTEYTPTLPTDAELLRIDKVTLDGAPVDIQTMWQPDQDFEADAETMERGVVTRTLATFTLTGATSDGEVKMLAVLRPTIAAATLPDLLATRYFEAIVSGCLAKLLAMPGTFSDPMGAKDARAEFEDAIGEATVDVFKGLTSTRPRSRVPWC